MFGQGRSQSGPALGLSINTGSANALSASSMGQTKPSTSLFGASSSTSQPQQSNTLLGAPAPSTGGLFSQGWHNQQQPSGSLLGGLSTQPAGGLLGSTTTQPTQAQQSGGLFAFLSQNPTSQGQSQQAQGSLLGASNQNRGLSLFPNAASHPPASNPQPSSIFTTSIGQHSQQYQTVPGVRISLNELRPITRFNDLHEELQKKIEEIDNFILLQMKYQGECAVLMSNVKEKSSPISDDVEYCGKTLETLQIALENDAEAIALAKTLITTDAANAKLSFDVIEALKMPQQFHHLALWQGQNSSQPVESSFSSHSEATPSKNLVSYFSQAAGSMAQVLSKYKANLAEVETYLRGLEVNLGQQMQQMAFVRGRDGGARNGDDQVRELAAVLREFETGILGVASKVGNSREKVQDLTLGDFGNGGRTRRF